MAFTQIPTAVTIISSLNGWQAISLTNMATSAESIIAAGSKVEIGGAFFGATTDITPNASSWTAVTTAATAYITLTPSGTAGSQVIAATYAETAPTWRDDYQGWYASAASLVRYIGGVTKTSATQYDDAFVIAQYQTNLHIEGGLLRLEANGKSTITGGVAATNVMASSVATQDDVFGALSPFIATGESIMLTGAVTDSLEGILVAATVLRLDTNTVRIKGLHMSSNGIVVDRDLDFNDGSAGTYIINIAW